MKAVFVTNALAGLLLLLEARGQTTWHVDGSGCFSQGGQGVASAPFTTLQEAASVAGAGDTILINPGQYHGELLFFCPVMLLAPGGPEETILNGSIGFSGPAPGQRAVIGLWIRDPDDSTPTPSIRITDVDCLVRNCVLTDNSLGGSSTISPGLAVQIGDAAVEIEDSLVADNIGGPGSGLTLSGAEPGASLSVRRTTFKNNVGVNPISSSSTIRINTTGASIEFIACTFSSNSVVEGVFYTIADATIDGCQFLSNVFGATGGAITAAQGNVLVRDSIIAGQLWQDPFSGSDAAGAVFVDDLSTVTVERCTIADNQSAFGSGSITAELAAGLTVVDSIIRDGGTAGPIVTGDGLVATVTRSNVEGGYPGAGNFDVDPVFADAANDDYHLAPSSPCINAGSYIAGPTETDVDGEPRVAYGQPDVGADEYHGLLGDCSLGNVGGAPSVDVLTINGTSGGFERGVAVDGFTPFSIEMAPSPAGGAGGFALWGMIGIPEVGDAVLTGIGGFCFAPQPLAPGDFAIFTVTDNLIGLAGLLPSTPAPWSFMAPGLPPGYDVTFQGVLQDAAAPTGLAVTNAVVVDLEGVPAVAPIPRPVLTGVQPAAADPGDTITVTGSDFIPGAAARLDGVPVGTTFVDPGTLTFVVPGTAFTGALVSVANPDGQTSIACVPLGQILPTLSQLQPGIADGGDVVTALGSGFVAGSVVLVDGLAAATTFLDPTLTFVVPSPFAGGAITVLNPDGETTNALPLGIPIPMLMSLLPASGEAGTTITAVGADFRPGATVGVDGQPASTTFVSETELTFVVPPGVGCTDTPTVGVANANGAVSPTTLTLGAAQPAITNLTPNPGPAAGGASLVILGSFPVAISSVTIGGTPASIQFASGTVVLVTTPAGAVGPATVVVSTPGGCSATATYTYQ